MNQSRWSHINLLLISNISEYRILLCLNCRLQSSNYWPAPTYWKAPCLDLSKLKFLRIMKQTFRDYQKSKNSP